MEISSWPGWISAAASVVSAIGVVFAFLQIRIASVQLQRTGDIERTTFEDAMSREYRDLCARLPYNAILNQPLSDEEYKQSLKDFVHYFDLSNEQIFLRQSDRVCRLTWENWRDGIQSNLSRPAFRKAWHEVNRIANSFEELRRLEKEGFATDPIEWKK